MNIISEEPGGGEQQQRVGGGGGKEDCQQWRISVMFDKAVSYTDIKEEQRNSIQVQSVLWILFLSLSL